MQKFSRRHFTVVELLVVISIIAVLAGLLVGGLTGADTQKMKAATKADIMKLEMALEAYKAENGSYPVTSNDTIEDENGDSESVTVIDVTTDTTVLTELLGFETFTLNDADQYPVDAWDRQLIYIPSSAYSDTVGEKVGSLDVHYNPKSFQLFSAGEDGDPDTEDDNIYNFDRK